MYYELYIDVLFAVNLVMDFFLLSVTKKILGSQASFLRTVLGSVTGALCVCVIILLRIPDTIWRAILMYAGVNSLMIITGLGVKCREDFIKSFICLYMGGFLLGGAYQWLSVNIRNFLVLSTGSYIVLMLGMQIYKKFQIRTQRIYKVMLYLNGRTLEAEALRDTGNSLRDPLSGRPVSILEAAVASQVLSEEEQQCLAELAEFRAETAYTDADGLKVHYIPYHSVGKKHGMMPGIVFDRMCVTGGGEHWVEKPVIAICKEPLAAKENYQMILHPEMVEFHTLIK